MAREAEAKVVIKGEDRTGPAADSARRRIKSISDQLQQLENIAAAGIGFHTIAAAVAAVHTSALEAEKSSSALNAVLKATGQAAGLTKGQIEGLVDELTGATLFDDESLRAAATALLRFRDIQEDVYKDALRMAPDLATALGTDVVSAAQTLGKALVDPEHGLKGLKAAGLKLSEQQGDLAQKLAETGDRAGAARVVLVELEKTIGGASRGANTGLSQATANTKKAWGELLESLGNTESYQKGVGGFLDWLTGKLKDAGQAMDEAKRRGWGYGTEFLAGAGGGLFGHESREEAKESIGVAGWRRKRQAELQESIERDVDPKWINQHRNELAALNAEIDRIMRAGRINLPDLAGAWKRQDEQKGEAKYAANKKTDEEAEKTRQEEVKRQAQEAAKRASFIEGVQKERDKLLLGETDSKTKEAERIGIEGADLERVKTLLQEVEARKAQLAAARENNAEFDKEFQEIERQRLALNDIIKARSEDAEAQQLEVDLLNESEPVRRARVAMLDAERLGLERNGAAWRELYATTLRTEEQREALRKFKDDHLNMFEALKGAVEGWGRKFTDTVTDMVMKGRLEFRSLADSIISDLVRIQVQKRMTDGLVKAGTSLLDSLFGGATQPPAPVVDAMPVPITPNARGGVYASPDLHHYANTIASSPTLFRFANGGALGLMGEAGAEAIMPLRRDSAGRLGVQAQGGLQNLRVEIVNQDGPPKRVVSAQPSIDGEGMLLQVVMRDVAEGGQVAQTLERTYGLSRSAGAMA